MAKRKSANSSKSSAAAPAKRKSSASGTSGNGPAALSAKKPSTAIQPAFSPHDIGNAAGEIWSLLSNNGEQTLAAIKKSVDAPADIVVAAIGWLAREGKLEFTTTGRTVKVSLC